MNILLGILLILHGLVHLLYAGQSLRFFDLRPGMVWPDKSWIFAKWVRVSHLRGLIAVALVLATIWFLIAGMGLILQQVLQLLALAGAAIFSSAIFLLAWDGKFQSLDDQGGIGLLINLAVLLFNFFLR